MTPTDVALIRDGFRMLAGEPDALASAFYGRLFTLDPALRPLFRDDLRAQGRKLVAALAHVVHGLDRLDTIIEDVRDLARRHTGYGVVPAHYATVGLALIGTLEARLGSDFTPEVRSAWTEAYGLLAGAMIEAARIYEAA